MDAEDPNSGPLALLTRDLDRSCRNKRRVELDDLANRSVHVVVAVGFERQQVQLGDREGS